MHFPTRSTSKPTIKYNLLMASTTLLLLLFFPVLLSSPIPASSEYSSSLQSYIIHVRSQNNLLNSDDTSLQNYYLSFLPPTTTASSSPRLLYSYREAITGFAAQLTSEQVKSMSSKTGFLRAYPTPTYNLMTTHTPTFLSLRSNTGLWRQSSQGEGIIIGMLDTGITSAHPSFSDAGMPPTPPRWKSPCQLPPSSPCNKKLIGARTFVENVNNVSDLHGHGSHTASTAAGNFVQNANVLGQANGTASGIAPRAHVAVYKVCDLQGCRADDLTAGFDFAIQDGVDVASLSIGGGSTSFATDPIAIAGFRAFQKGITVVCAAGNDGPFLGSLSNEAPWLITVGASTLNRVLKVVVRLGDGKEFVGEALFQPRNFSSQQQLPLVAPKSCGDLSAVSVTGKIVLCESVTNVDAVKAAGGVAVILKNNKIEGSTIVLELQPLPSSLVTFEDGVTITAYAGSAINPTAAIEFCGTVIGSPPPASMVAYFSSRGPSISSAGILKPDIIAPGVNVLAAWPKPISNDTNHNSKRRRAADFNIISGTSMATPHITGVVALLKKAHPNWSPAVIKSAIMTTADVVDNRGKPIMDEKLKPADHFALGAGHVNPEKSTDPGLVYNISSNDYIRYICGVGYSDRDVTIIAGREVSCAQVGKIAEGELNYPSILVVLNVTKMTVNRTVTNVGEAGSRYTVEVESPKGVKVTVKPRELKFSEVEEEKRFSVTFESSVGLMNLGKSTQGSLKWVSAKRVVRSPIVVML